MSTTEPLLEYIEEITTSLGNNTNAVGVFIALNNVSETVCHNIRCTKNIALSCVVSHRKGHNVN